MDNSIDRSEDIGIIQDPVARDVHYTPGSTWGDPDNDGDLDLLVLTSGTAPVTSSVGRWRTI